jgi:hypothetical protein
VAHSLLRIRARSWLMIPLIDGRPAPMSATAGLRHNNSFNQQQTGGASIAVH